MIDKDPKQMIAGRLTSAGYPAVKIGYKFGRKGGKLLDYQSGRHIYVENKEGEKYLIIFNENHLPNHRLEADSVRTLFAKMNLICKEGAYPLVMFLDDETSGFAKHPRERDCVGVPRESLSNVRRLSKLERAMERRSGEVVYYVPDSQDIERTWHEPIVPNYDLLIPNTEEGERRIKIARERQERKRSPYETYYTRHVKYRIRENLCLGSKLLKLSRLDKIEIGIPIFRNDIEAKVYKLLEAEDEAESDNGDFLGACSKTNAYLSSLTQDQIRSLERSFPEMKFSKKNINLIGNSIF